MTLFSELKRRRVFRVAAMYGVTAWAIIEVSATVLPALHLPEELVSTIVVLLIAGFPIALVLAWVFDISPQGIERTPAPPPAERSLAARIGAALLVVVATLALGAFFYWRVERAEAPTRDSIAVLPFENMAADASSDYFSDGISEELLNLLAKVPGLKVAARTSSFAYKNQEVDVRTIASQLGVATVLEGSVRWSEDGGRVRITAQLIDAATGYHLWSQTYDRPVEAIFALQDEIARAIVRALKPELVQGGEGALALGEAAAPTQDVEAYTLYLQGRALWQQGGREALEQSVDLFQRAVARDPGFARAYANLSVAFAMLPEYSEEAPEPLYGEAREAAMTALTIDAQLAEAHAVLAKIADDHWDWSDAETGFYFATSLDPDEPTAHHWYSVHLGGAGRLGAAIEEARTAVRLEPGSALFEGNLAALLDQGGLADEAEAARLRAAELGFAEAPDAGSLRLRELVRDGDLDEAFVLAGSLVDARRLRPPVLWRQDMATFRSDPRFPELMRSMGLADYWRRYGWADACRPSEGGFRCG